MDNAPRSDPSDFVESARFFFYWRRHWQQLFSESRLRLSASTVSPGSVLRLRVACTAVVRVRPRTGSAALRLSGSDARQTWGSESRSARDDDSDPSPTPRAVTDRDSEAGRASDLVRRTPSPTQGEPESRSRITETRIIVRSLLGW